jgi:iron(III) transport system ATP-binding protein
MLKLENVSIHLEGRQIINDISFGLQKGEVLSIVGESGVGKTTLLRAISGLIDVAGVITFDGEKVIGPSEKLVPGVAGVATVFQDYQLMHNRTVFENIAYPLRAYVEEDQISLTLQLLEVLLLTSHQDHYPNELSGGQKQRVAIARALASEPRLLLLDEPFSNMDVSLRERIKGQVFSYLKGENITAILVTHDPKDALAVSDQIAVLRQGQIVQKASPRELFENPVDPYVMSCFGHCNFWSAETFVIDFEGPEEPADFSKVGVRVEKLKVGEDVAYSFTATVDHSTYQGDNYLISGHLKSGSAVYFYHAVSLPTGKAVLLNIHPEDIKFW